MALLFVIALLQQVAGEGAKLAAEPKPLDIIAQADGLVKDTVQLLSDVASYTVMTTLRLCPQSVQAPVASAYENALNAWPKVQQEVQANLAKLEPYKKQAKNAVSEKAPWLLDAAAQTTETVSTKSAEVSANVLSALEKLDVSDFALVHPRSASLVPQSGSGRLFLIVFVLVFLYIARYVLSLATRVLFCPCSCCCKRRASSTIADDAPKTKAAKKFMAKRNGKKD